MAGARVLLSTALLCLLLGSPAAGRRLVCWQALLQCQEESDCSYAYSLYAEACAPVLPHGDQQAGRVRRCPSHCISALIQLNQTVRGPALEDCDCGQDEICRATKRAIEPCLPRTGAASAAAAGPGVLGCTEARRRCERDHRCSAALNRYLAHCGKLFNGLRCTHECRGVIQDMLALPKALLLSDCVCDGLERPICEAVKENMARLCFGQDLGNYHPGGSSGGSSPDMAFDEYYDEEYEEESLPPRLKPDLHQEKATGNSSARAASPTPLLLLLLLAAWTSVASILRLRL